MSLEVVCGSCQGRLRVETPGVVVACPHCGTHLSVAAPEASGTGNEAENSADAPAPSGETTFREPEGDQQTAPPPPQETTVPDFSLQTSGRTDSVQTPPEPAPADGPADEVPDFNAIAGQVDEQRPPWMPPEDDGDEEPAAFPDFEAGSSTTTSEQSSEPASSFSADEGTSSEASAGFQNGPAAAVETAERETDDETPAPGPEDAPETEPFFGQSQTTSAEEATSADESKDVPFPGPLGDDEAAPVTPPVMPADSEQSEEEREQAASEPMSGESPEPAAPPEAGVVAGHPSNDESRAESSAAPMAAQPADGTEQAVATAEPVGATEASESDDVREEQAAAVAPSPSAAPAPSRRRSRGVPKFLFVLVLSYASAVTLALIYLLLTTMGADPHQLESLPDIKPPRDKDGNIQKQLIPEEASLPAGHTLELGESRRFGNVKVTPLKVTRGPVTLAHFNTGEVKQSDSPSEEVLKLWLRFENVSEDQVFSPLDRELIFNRGASQKADRIRANNFVCRREDKAGGPYVLVYNLLLDDIWDVKDQNAGRQLKPGETWTTYLPTTPGGIDRLEGELLWRVHFRKGYNPETRRGVTTLIEVEFHSDQIEGERSHSRKPEQQSA